MLFQRKRINVASLATFFDVSEATIRKDLDVLEREGILRKMYGGAVYNEDYTDLPSFTDDYSYFYRLEAPNLDAKKEIANTASMLIADGDIIFIGNGSTCACMADSILLNKSLSRLTVVTNNLYVINRLSPAEHITLISTGGKLTKLDAAIGFFSEIAPSVSTNILSALFYTKSFFSIDALSIDNGYMVTLPEALAVLSVILQRSQDCYVLVDSSKFDTVSMLQLAQFTEINKIVTNKEVPDAYKTFCFSNDIQIFLPVDMY